ncbi:30S ribosomal protein S3Ae [uncultured archaeon]|nr:30S ribosomal protein S3Ae [uncultured archaeon]
MADVQKKTKVVDTFKLKTWYAVQAPDFFDKKEIGQVVALEPDMLKNRVMSVSLTELSGSYSQSNAFTSVKFRISDVQGKTASTKFIGHDLAPGYIKTLLRRRRSIIYNVDDAVTKDGQQIRIKSVSVTAFRASEAVRHALRAGVSVAVKAAVAEVDMATLAQELLYGKFAAKVFSKVKSITPLRRLEIRKSEVTEVFA